MPPTARPAALPPCLSLSTALAPRRRAACPPPRATASPDDDAPPPAPAATSQNVAPWTLMGRVVQEGSLFGGRGVAQAMAGDHVQAGLIRSAAARASGLELEDFEARLADLLVIMPFLQDRLVRMKPELLAALAADVDATAGRLIALRELLPGADVQAVASKRPSILLDGDWARVGPALEALRALYDDGAIAEMVSQEPLLLVEDVNKVVRELERFVPGRDHVAALRANPSLASQVAGLRLTGFPRSAVLNMLVKQPEVVHSVVSGTRSLGPGAEYMRDI